MHHKNLWDARSDPTEKNGMSRIQHMYVHIFYYFSLDVNAELVNSSNGGGIKIMDLSSKNHEKVKKMWNDNDIEIISTVKKPKNPCTLPIVHAGKLFPNASIPKSNFTPQSNSTPKLNSTPELNPTLEFDSSQMESIPIIKKEKIKVEEMNFEVFKCPCKVTGCENKLFRERKKLEDHLSNVHGYPIEVQRQLIQDGLLKINKSSISIE